MAKIGRALLAITLWVVGAMIVLVGFFGVMWVVGGAIETVGEGLSQTERCQKRAATPYEYHRCR